MTDTADTILWAFSGLRFLGPVMEIRGAIYLLNPLPKDMRDEVESMAASAGEDSLKDTLAMADTHTSCP